MATVTSREGSLFETDHPLARTAPAFQAYRILYIGFIIIPLVAGIDKFLERLVDWDVYLSPFARNILGQLSHEFMLAVGVIEIVAGLGVAIWPRVFAYIVAVWLTAITINLVLSGAYYDIALRDFGLALGALALGRLATSFRS